MRQMAFGVAGLVLAGMSWAQVTERESVNSGGVQAESGAELPNVQGRVVSADGRYVVFMSSSSNLVPGDTNGTWDIFLRDRLRGSTERLSIATSGSQGNGFSGLYGITMTPDGRFVAFESRANTLVPGDTNGVSDIFLRDRWNGTTVRVSVGAGGVQGNNESWFPSISSDGRYIAFMSRASNLVLGDTNAADDVFVHDRVTGATDRVSVSGGGAQGDLRSDMPSISANGRLVAFRSVATNLVPGDTNASDDVFVHDRATGATERISVATGGGQGDHGSAAPTISSDGRFVAYTSYASNLVPGDTNGTFDVFLYDRRSGTTERVSVATGGVQGNNQSTFASISADGRFVAFESVASNFVPGGAHGLNVYVRDRLNGTTDIVSLTTGGAQTHYGLNELPSISEDGRYVVFRSYDRDLVPGDSNGLGDVFLRDREAAGFISLCDPGVGGVIGCPCLNPPGGSGQGCDNSSATGGSVLSASGIAYLSIDSLVFTTSGELPTALSVLMQGNALLANGVVYGQGIRCSGGMTKRLFVKAAVAGDMTAPDFAAGDPTVSARSAAKGDVIQAGQSRWYLVYYRDPTVLGGCPATSTFNATQTGQVTWWP